eukprot:jgi/Mesen1/5394/ME000268S04591
MSQTQSTVTTGVAVGMALAGVLTGYLISRSSVMKPKIKKTTVKHVFLAKFKDDMPEKEIQEAIAGYRDLIHQIKEMKGFEWGTDVSVEGLSKGFTHVFVTTFDSPEDRDTYIEHPVHKGYAEYLLSKLKDTVIVDYTPEVALSDYYY